LVAQAADPRAREVYDPWLGWKQRPDGTNWSAAGMRLDPRAPLEPSPAPRAGVLRIALFGDSFTESIVDYHQTWGVQLQTNLLAAGINAEVLNFGNSAYGMDQALLRWRMQGSRMRPHLVIFGLQAENLERNINLIRLFQAYDSQLPFTKPRFVLQGDGALKLVNSPCAPPEKLPELLRGLDAWEWTAHEAYYHPEDYAPTLWRRSRLLAFIEMRLDIRRTIQARVANNQAHSEAGRLGRAIIRQFAEEARADAGAAFLILHLPPPRDIAALAEGKSFTHEPLLRDLVDAGFEVLRPEQALLEVFKVVPSEQFERQGHYAEAGESAIARHVAERLVERQRKRAREANPGGD